MSKKISTSVNSPSISGLPNGKDLLNASAEELESLKIDNQTLQEFEMTDGKDRDKLQEEIKKVKDLEDLLGFKEMNPYGTLNKAVFEDR